MKSVIGLIAISFLSGCASMQSVDLIENQTTVVTKENSDEVSLNTIYVRQYANEIFVKGRVSRSNDERLSKGFVTVDLYNENGVRIDSVDATITFKRSGSKASRSGSFSVQLEEIPQKNSKVVVTAHDKRKKSSGSGGTLELM